MKVNLQILSLPTLAQVVGKKKLEIEFPGRTVGDLIDHLVQRYGPKARQALYDETGQLDLVIQILVNEKEWISRERLDTVLKDGDSVALMMLVAGG